ncbi:MAG: hypothetical protein K2G55_08640, partial [Lachnospiraceae bacterium]|nr:hypothetical protein [Lachnospiraceae bacterium]
MLRLSMPVGKAGDWQNKKSVDDLARSMSLNISKVWLLADGKEILVDTDQVEQGDCIVIRMGSMILFDGVAAEGRGEGARHRLWGENPHDPERHPRHGGRNSQA